MTFDKKFYKNLLRFFHFLIVSYLIFGIGYIYYSAFIQQINLLSRIFIISLIIEGALIYINRGDCVLIYIQKRVGDDVPFFDLILPKKYATHAVKFFAILTLIGLFLLVLRIN